MRLQSQFRLTYNTILHILRIRSNIQIQDLIRKSFFENEAQKSIPSHTATLEQSRINKFGCEICLTDIESYTECIQELMLCTAEMWCTLSSGWIGQAFVPGRMVLMFSLRPAVLLSKTPSGRAWNVLMLPSETMCRFISGSIWEPCPAVDAERMDADGSFPFGELKCITMNEVSFVGDFAVKITENINWTGKNVPKDALKLVAQKAVLLIKPFEYTGWPEYPFPRQRTYECALKIRQRMTILKSMDNTNFLCLACPLFSVHYSSYLEEKKVSDRIKELRWAISGENLTLLPEYQSRLAVLKHLCFVDDDALVNLKGRVACEIQTADELLTTELIMEHCFKELGPADIVALLSAFVFQERSDADETLQVCPHLTLYAGIMSEKALELANIQKKCGLSETIALSNKERLHFGLVSVVYAWASGESFRKITEMTSVQEGTIVRTILRLDETCRDIRNSARIMGDTFLEEKMLKASELIKRDICFSSSLYIE